MIGMNDLQPNKGKKLTIRVDSSEYVRLPIKTHLITQTDDIVSIVNRYALPYLQRGDFLFISERIVAIIQGRSFPIEKIKPSNLARFLAKFVYRSPHGIGLGSPWTMELAIREAGMSKVLLAAFISMVTKLFGMKGVFYKIVGKNINAVDGPCSYTIPPYNKHAKLAPINPQKVARSIKVKFGFDAVIIDANDLGVAVLGKSTEDISNEFCEKVFSDNPLGQSFEQTPLCIVRKV